MADIEKHEMNPELVRVLRYITQGINDGQLEITNCNKFDYFGKSGKYTSIFGLFGDDLVDRSSFSLTLYEAGK